MQLQPLHGLPPEDQKNIKIQIQIQNFQPPLPSLQLQPLHGLPPEDQTCRGRRPSSCTTGNHLITIIMITITGSY